MSALVVATVAALAAVGLIVGVIVLAMVAIAGAKVVNAAHDGGTWFINHRQQRRSHRLAG